VQSVERSVATAVAIKNEAGTQKGDFCINIQVNKKNSDDIV